MRKLTFKERQNVINIRRKRNYGSWIDKEIDGVTYFERVNFFAARQDELNADMKKAAAANKGHSARRE